MIDGGLPATNATEAAPPQGRVPTMMHARKIAALFALALVSASVSAQPAAAYPDKPIHIIVGFGAGSTADVLARILGNKLTKSLGQQIVVENRPGAASMIAAEAVARAPKDGYTLFMATVANTINPSLSAKSTFNLGRDMAPIASVGVIPNVLVANPSVPASNIKELVALAKTKPDSLTFATSGVGTAGHLAAELFNQQAGTKIVLVNYSGGSAQAVTDLLTGRVSLMFAVASTMLPHVRAGKLKALAVAQGKRANSMPDVPTMTEAGMSGFDASIWVGLLAPAGTPKDVVEKLSHAVNEALEAGDVLDAMHKQGYDSLGGSPEEFARFVAADIKKWTGVATAAGLRK